MRKITMSPKVKSLMLEALRRFHAFNLDRSTNSCPTTFWVGLGPPSEYKAAVDAGLLFPFSPTRPRCKGWYIPTHKGIQAMMQLANEGYVVRGYELVKLQ